MAGQVGRSGGARVGAGRPAKSEIKRWLDGNAGKRGKKIDRPKPLPPLMPVLAPEGLTEDELVVWLRHAPHALAARTLTPASAEDLGALCQLEVEMQGVLAARRAEGWTTTGLMLAKEYRGLVQRIEAKRRAFRLAPMGKPLELPIDGPKDEWADIDEADAVN